MLTRIISGIVLAIVIGSALLVGGPYLLGLLLVISLFGVYEIYRVYKIEKSILGILGYFFTILYYISVFADSDRYMLLSITALFVLTMGAYVFTYPKFTSTQACMGLFAMIYVAVMLSFIYRISIINFGNYLVWLVFICSWGADTCAYFVGVTCGKHKMSPKLSPKKSVEGAIGGVIGSMIIGFIFGYILKGRIGTNAPFLCTISAGVGALISMIGDLAASAIKREHSVKDYGRLIPGHGGIMDRFDSTIFTAPALYIVLVILGAAS